MTEELLLRQQRRLVDLVREYRRVKPLHQSVREGNTTEPCLHADERQYVRAREGVLALDDRRVDDFYFVEVKRQIAQGELKLLKSYAQLVLQSHLEGAPSKALCERFATVIDVLNPPVLIRFEPKDDAKLSGLYRLPTESQTRGFLKALERQPELAEARPEAGTPLWDERCTRVYELETGLTTTLVDAGFSDSEAASLIRRLGDGPDRPAVCCHRYQQGGPCNDCGLNIDLRLLNKDAFERDPTLKAARAEALRGLPASAPVRLAIYQDGVELPRRPGG